MNFWVVSGCYLGIAFLGIGIFIWGKPEGNSLFDRLYQIVCQQAPRLLKQGLDKVFGKRAGKFLDWLWVYICYTSNPIVQIFYLLVVVGGYLCFAYFGYPHVPNRYAGGWHKYSGFCVFMACVSVWWKACRTDPGMITDENVDELCQIFEWDKQIFFEGECPTCQLKKPARSKHCSLCNCCVARFDHHCIWLNNCVGAGNHKWFLGFLFWHLVLCFYGAGLGSVIAFDLVMQKDLFNAVFVDPVTKERHKASYMIIMQYMLATEGMVLFVTALCLIMGLVLCGFFMWHLNLVRIGTTTNELSKWNYYRWCMKQDGEEGKTKLADMRNIYNQGLVANYKAVFYPIDVNNLPGRRPEKAATSENGKTGPEKAATSENGKTADQGKKNKKAKKHD